MSWGKANIPTKSPKTAGVDGNDLSTNEQAVPVRWLSGLEWCPLTWVVDKVYNQRTEEIRQKAGKGKEMDYAESFRVMTIVSDEDWAKLHPQNTAAE